MLGINLKIKSFKIFPVLFFIFLSHSLINAQITEQWVKRYNGLANNFDFANYAICTPSGNVVVTGMVTDTISHGTDVFTIMYSPSGSLIWKDSYNGIGNSTDYGSYVTTDLSGNVLIAGSSIYQEPGYGALLLKYDSSGNRKWVVRDDLQSEYRFGTVVKTDSSGSIYFGTKHGTFATGTGKIIKYNSSGTLLWVSQPGRVYDILISNDGYIYAGGTNNFKYFLDKYTRTGTLIWSDTLSFGPGSGGGVLNDGPCYLASDAAGNIYFTGFGLPLGSEDIYILKINSSGQILWQKSYSYSPVSTESVHGIKLDSSGNIYLGGTTDKGNPNFYLDYLVLKYSNNGVFQWAGIYDGLDGANDYLSGIIIDNNNNVIASGYSQQNSNSGSYDIVTVKFNDSGNVIWEKKYNGPNDSTDYGNCITRDISGNIYIAGGSGNYNSGLDFITIKYSQSTGVNLISDKIPSEYKLFQNYPNPFNPSTQIRFDIPGKVFVSLKVFNILGREVKTLVNEMKDAGSYSADFNGNELSSGLYFYRLITGNFTETKKMLMIK